MASPTTMQALRVYLQLHDQLCSRPNTEAVFISPAGARLLYCNVHATWRQLHSFAVRTLSDARSGRCGWCSPACRQAGWRRPHPGTPPGAGPARAAAGPPAHGVRMPGCGERYLGQQRYEARGIFCSRIGPGGPCPHCAEPVAIQDIIDTT